MDFCGEVKIYGTQSLGSYGTGQCSRIRYANYVHGFVQRDVSKQHCSHSIFNRVIIISNVTVLLGRSVTEIVGGNSGVAIK